MTSVLVLTMHKLVSFSVSSIETEVARSIMMNSLGVFVEV